MQTLISRKWTDFSRKVKGGAVAGLATIVGATTVPLGDARFVELLELAVTIYAPAAAPVLVPLVGPAVGAAGALVGAYLTREKA